MTKVDITSMLQRASISKQHALVKKASGSRIRSGLTMKLLRKGTSTRKRQFGTVIVVEDPVKIVRLNESALPKGRPFAKQNMVLPRKTHAVKRDEARPTAFIRSILKSKGSVSDGDKGHKTHESLFTKSSEEEIAAYNVDVVNAVRTGDVEQLRSIHNSGTTLQCCNRFGESLLHMACRRGDADVVRFLVNEARVSIFKRDDFGRTPVHDACWTSVPQLDIMEILLKADGGHPDVLLAADVRGHTPLDYARREHWDAWVNFFNQRKELIAVN